MIYGHGKGVPRNAGGESVFRSAFVYGPPGGFCTECGYIMNPDDGAVATGWFKAGPYAWGPRYICAWGINAEWPGAGSNHAGVEQCLFGDASVRPIATTCEYWVWCSLNGYDDGIHVPGNL
jgi:hypothetical protein